MGVEPNIHFKLDIKASHYFWDWKIKIEQWRTQRDLFTEAITKNAYKCTFLLLNVKLNI